MTTTKDPLYMDATPGESKDFQTPPRFEDQPEIEVGWERRENPIELPEYIGFADWHSYAKRTGYFTQIGYGRNPIAELTLPDVEIPDTDDDNPVRESELYVALMEEMEELMWAYVGMDTVEAISEGEQVTYARITVEARTAEEVFTLLGRVFDVYERVVSEGE